MHPADEPALHGKGRRARPDRDAPVSRGRAGEQRRRGSIAGPAGPFTLAPGLTAPGALRLAEAIELICADLHRQADAGTITPATAYASANSISRFGDYAARQGTESLDQVDQTLCELYVHSRNMPGYGLIRIDGAPAPSQQSTKHGRRHALRVLFKTARALGLDDRDPAADIALPVRTLGRTITATAEQVQRCKDAARITLTETRHPALLGLFLAGQGTAELPYTTREDVHLDDRLVWSHGGTKATPRWVPLDDWQTEMIRRRIEWLDANPAATPALAARRTLIYAPTRDAVPHHFRQAATANAIGTIMRRAGLSQIPGMGAKSLRQYVAHDVFDRTGSLAQVATRLGMASLDAAADLLGLDWRADNTLAGPTSTDTAKQVQG